MNTAVSCVFVNYRTGQRPVGFNTICFWQENVVSLQQTERTGGTNRPFLSLHTAFSVILSRGKVFLVSHVIFFGSHVVDFIPIPRKDRSHLRARFCGLKVKNVNVDGCSPSLPAASSEFGCRKSAVIRGKRFLCSS